MTGANSRVSGVPIDVPAASSNQPQTRTSNTHGSRSTAATTTPRRRASSRVGRRALSAIRDSLSDRDWKVLRAVAAHRYLTGRQVEGFCFADHATPLTAARVSRRVLRRLNQMHLLEHLDRRVGGVRAGSASYVWQLGRAGQRLLRKAGEIPPRSREPGLLFLDHCLTVADAHLALVRAHRGDALELIGVQTEPECWRRYTGLGGARLVLQPDLYVVTGAGEFEDHWFVEIDRGTENPSRLLAKCHRYETYRHTGAEQADGGSFPLVVWVMSDQAQADRLTRAIDSDASLNRRLYRVTTAEGFADLIRGGAV